MFAAITHLARLLRIARTFARHDALFPLERSGVSPVIVAIARAVSRRAVPGRPGERLAAALEELGPSFIKLGQALSVRSDLIGEELADDLAALQDRLPPFAGADARAIVESELGSPIDDLFESFDDTPVAAASIAQVHFAITTQGDAVAVKVLRPGIEARFRRDVDLLLWLARLVERTRPALRRLRPLDVVRTFEATVNTEMDLRLEAAAASELRENSADDEKFRVPDVDWNGSAVFESTISPRSKPPVLRRATSCSYPRKRFSARYSATGSSMPTCIPATCSWPPTGRCVRSISASWAGSTPARGTIWPTC